MSGWSTVNPTTGGRGDKTKLDDLIELHKLTPREQTRVRPIGPIVSFVRFWISILVDDKNAKTKGKKKVISVAKYCLDHDPVKGEFVRSICPYRKAYESGQYNYKIIGADGKERPVIQLDRKYLCNFLIRDIQNSEPKKVPKHTRKELKETTILGHKGYWKEPGSDSWTPVKAIQIANTMAIKLKSVTDQNKRTIKGEKKVFELSHPKYGMDVNLYYDPNQSGTGMYDATVILADDEEDNPRKPLTETEMGYLLQNLDVIPAQTEKIEDAKTEWKHLEERIVPDPADEGKSKKKKSGSLLDADEDEDEDDEPKAKKSSKKSKDKVSAKSSKKAKPADDDDDDDIDLDNIEDLDVSSKKKSKKSKEKPLVKAAKVTSGKSSSKVTKLADKKKDKSSSKDLKAKKKLKKAA